MTNPRTNPSPFDIEPVAIGFGGLALIIDAAIAMCTLLNWFDLSQEQVAAIIGFVTIMSGVIGATIRANVWSPASVAQMTQPPEVT